jgi:hypothetical protein
MGGSIDKTGLNHVKLSHPWKDFLSFAEERYSIFLKKEAGEPRPWTKDSILHNYKFTNLFREDDTVSRFIFNWVKPLKGDLKLLLTNLIYARFNNKPSTMLATGFIDKISPKEFIAIIDKIGGGKTKAKVNKNAVWKGPYQIAGAFKTRLGYPYREQLIAYHIPKTIDDLVVVIKQHHGDDLKQVLAKMNQIWGYENNMVFTQVLLDLTYLRPDLISPTCFPPPLSGLEPVANMLDKSVEELILKAMNEWNTKSKFRDRQMMLKDAEHSLCEWRKYLCWSRGLSNPRKYKQVTEGLKLGL